MHRWKNDEPMNKTKTPASEKAERKEREESLEDEQQAERDEKALRKIEGYVETCRNLYRSPLISDATRREYEEHVISFMREKATVEQAAENIGYAMDTLAKAAHAREYFEAKLSTAVESGWISAASATRWKERFNDSNLIEWQREKWLEEKFPAYCARWKQVAEDRDDVLARAALHDVDMSDEPGLAKLKSKTAFLSLDYDHRKELVARVDASLLAVARRKKELYKNVRDTLAAASRGSEACIHSGLVGPWLKEAFASDNPAGYFTQVLSARLEERRALRSDFDTLAASLSAKRVPDGLRLPSVSQFLQWSPGACASYLLEARHRMDAHEREQKGEQAALDAEKKSIRASMDAKDWKGAESALAAMCAEHDDDAELKSMKRYLEAHREESDEKKAPQTDSLLREMRSMVSHIPSEVQWVYRTSMERGPESFGKLIQHMDKHVWREDQKVNPVPLMTESRDLAHDNDTGAEEDVAVQRVTAEGEEKRERAEDEAPAVLMMTGDTESQVKALDILERSDADAHRSEVSGVASEQITLKQQRYLVHHVNAPLMSRLRTLDEQDVRFTMAA
jgi:hypothetical protein